MGQQELALRINIVLVGLAGVFCLLAAVTVRGTRQPQAGPFAHAEAAVGLPPMLSKPDKPLAMPAVSTVPKRWLVALYALLLLVVLISSSTGLGWVQAAVWSIYISQVQGLLVSLLLLAMLQYRTLTHNQQRQQALLALQSTQLQVAHEQAARQEHQRLLAMLAHEIKTPLATMHMRLDPQAPGSAPMRMAMRDMNEVIERCLLALRMDEQKLAPQWQQLDLLDVLRSSVAACSQPQQVVLQLPPAGVPLQTDVQLLSIMVGNLLENACKYSPPQAPVELACTVLPGGALVRISVANAPGQAGWPDASRVFEKYYRAPQAQRYSGTGLGLYLVRSLAHGLGGEVDYRPQQDKVVFALELPLVGGSQAHPLG